MALIGRADGMIPILVLYTLTGIGSGAHYGKAAGWRSPRQLVTRNMGFHTQCLQVNHALQFIHYQPVPIDLWA